MIIIPPPSHTTVRPVPYRAIQQKYLISGYRDERLYIPRNSRYQFIIMRHFQEPSSS